MTETTRQATQASAAEPSGNGPTLAHLLWTYAYAYTAAHDFAVSDRIMADDYVLHMGTHTLRGRREEYQPATRRQYRQYPTLGFTVHRLVTNGERAALHFTEHGRSVHDGRAASWQGVSLYRWNGRLLTECRVEQDYHSRMRQLESGEPLAVASPGIDPWSTEAVPDDATAEERVREWLESGAWVTDPEPQWDDGSARARWVAPGTEILDLFSAGAAVGFHVRLAGRYAGGVYGSERWTGRTADMFVTGIVDTGERITGQLISDRHSMMRRLAEAG